MPKKILILIAVLALFTSRAIAQNRVTLSGYIRDAGNNETLIGATVFIKELGIGASTNNFGFYSISMPAASYTVTYTYGGFASQTQTIEMVASRANDVALTTGQAIEEVEIKAGRKDQNVKSAEMGTTSLSIDQIKTLPVLFGEVDILKTLQLMPGVQNAGEGNSGFYVRGGGPDQNLILLDDAVVYNTGHLFGFFSVFNSDAIKNVTLIKGTMPANYGGRLSSVVDVSMKEGNAKSYHATGGIGLIASRLTLEGPIKKGKGSFILSGRRTYIDVLTKPLVSKSSSFRGSGYFFYDLNLKANYELGKKDHIYLSGYFGRDEFTFKSASQNFQVNIPWGNSTATLRYNHLFTDKLFLNTTLVYNDYNFTFNGSQGNGGQTFDIKLASGIRDYNAKVDLDYFSSGNHHIKFGAAYIWHKFIPNQISGRADTVNFAPNNALIKHAHEAAAYVLDEWDPLPWLRVNAGLRYSLFAQTGPYKSYTYDGYNQKTDSIIYTSSNIVKTYAGLEPRLNLRFDLGGNSSLKTSIVRSNQYIHLVTNNGTTLPTDIWVPSTAVVKPQQSWQYSAGYFKNWLDNKLETSLEIYYKDMKNQIEYHEGYTPQSLHDPENDFVFGRGQAYGAEFFINKTKGKWTGWIGYTLSWSYRYFDSINNGERYPAKYDRRHDLSVVVSYEQSRKWTFSGVFVYGSGNAITLPTAYYFIDNKLVEEFSKINQYRIFPYHRLDLSAIYTPQRVKPRRWQGSWAFSIYNVYNRFNPYFLYVDPQGNTSTGVKVKVMEVSIFPILPSVTYNFRF